MIEFVVAFPMVLILMLGVVQVSHLWMARLTCHYAAYCAARSALVSSTLADAQPAAQRAAEHILAWIAVGERLGETLPGWGNIPGSGGVDAMTRVTLRENPQWNIEARVEFDFGLIVPIVGPMMAMANPAGEWYETGDWGYPLPTMTLTETVTLPRPYRYLNATRTDW